MGVCPYNRRLISLKKTNQLLGLISANLHPSLHLFSMPAPAKQLCYGLWHTPFCPRIPYPQPTKAPLCCRHGSLPCSSTTAAYSYAYEEARANLSVARRVFFPVPPFSKAKQIRIESCYTSAEEKTFLSPLRNTFQKKGPLIQGQ